MMGGIFFLGAVLQTLPSIGPSYILLTDTVPFEYTDVN